MEDSKQQNKIVFIASPSNMFFQALTRKRILPNHGERELAVAFDCAKLADRISSPRRLKTIL
jgi:hypothetical protein